VLQQNADRVLAKLFDALRVEHVFAEQKGSDGAIHQNNRDRPSNHRQPDT